MKNKDSEQDEERGEWEKWTLSRSIKDGFQNKERERERERKGTWTLEQSHIWMMKTQRLNENYLIENKVQKDS